MAAHDSEIVESGINHEIAMNMNNGHDRRGKMPRHRRMEEKVLDEESDWMDNLLDLWMDCFVERGSLMERDIVLWTGYPIFLKWTRYYGCCAVLMMHEQKWIAVLSRLWSLCHMDNCKVSCAPSIACVHLAFCVIFVPDLLIYVWLCDVCVP